MHQRTASRSYQRTVVVARTILRSADAPDVAGQDLVTLFAASYGSLGLITEATFRLTPLSQMSSGRVAAVRRSRGRGAARRGGIRPLDGTDRERPALAVGG